MKTSEVTKEFGGVPDLAAELGITQQAIYQWGDEVPEARQWQIELLRLKKANEAVHVASPSNSNGKAAA